MPACPVPTAGDEGIGNWLEFAVSWEAVSGAAPDAETLVGKTLTS
jgi:hypothetical protein